jgi:hypothetical protein
MTGSVRGRGTVNAAVGDGHVGDQRSVRGNRGWGGCSPGEH